MEELVDALEVVQAGLEALPVAVVVAQAELEVCSGLVEVVDLKDEQGPYQEADVQ